MKRSNYILLAVILLIVAISGFAFSDNQSLTVYTEDTVWIPQFLSAECVERANSYQLTSLGNIPRSGDFYTCQSGVSTDHWIPPAEQNTGLKCEFIVEPGTFSPSGNIQASYLCDGVVDDKAELDGESCEKESGLLSAPTNDNVFTVSIGDTVFVNPDGRNVEMQAKLPSYGLQVETADGRVLSTTNNCEVNSLNRDYHPVDGMQTYVAPDNPFNVVTGLSPARTIQVVSLDDVDNGNLIYIVQPGEYYQVKEAEDGFKYVDTSIVNPLSDDDIECIPRTTGCSDDAKIIPLEGQSVDEFGGAVVDYSPVAGDSSKLCKYENINGKLSLTGDCIEFVDCEGLGQFDTKTGECVEVVPVVEPEEDGIDWALIAAVLAGMSFVIVIVVAVQSRSGKKGRGKKR